MQYLWYHKKAGNLSFDLKYCVYRKEKTRLSRRKSLLSIIIRPLNTLLVLKVIFKTKKTIEIYLVRLNEVCGKVLNEKMHTSLLKQHCYCPMLLMQTTITSVCLQTKAIFHHLYGFLLVFLLNVMSNTLQIALTRLWEHISTINSV